MSGRTFYLSERTSGSHLVQSPAQRKVNYSRLFRAVFSWVLRISKGGGVAAFQGNLFSEWKKIPLMFKWNFPYFSLCMLPFVLLLGTTKRNLSLLCLVSPHQVFIQINQIPLSLLLFGLNKHSSLSLSLWNRCSGPLKIWVTLYWTLSMSLLQWGAQNCTQYFRCGLTFAE